MPIIPAMLLRKLYVKGSLQTTPDGFGFTIKNVLAPATVIGVLAVSVDGNSIPLENVTIGRQGTTRPVNRVSPAWPFPFDLHDEAVFQVQGVALEPGLHALSITIKVKEVGELNIQFQDHVV